VTQVLGRLYIWLLGEQQGSKFGYTKLVNLENKRNYGDIQTLMIKNVTTNNNPNCVVLLLKSSTKSIFELFCEGNWKYLRKQKTITMTCL
jgi:vacuolar-type H+-ATPase subunit E/Vma4